LETEADHEVAQALQAAEGEVLETNSRSTSPQFFYFTWDESLLLPCILPNHILANVIENY
jgi:hypothetical protein